MAYYGDYTTIMVQSQPTNQDILNAIAGLTKTVNQNSTDLTSLSGIVSKIAVDVETLKSDVTEMKETLERHEQKLDKLAANQNNGDQRLTRLELHLGLSPALTN